MDAIPYITAEQFIAGALGVALLLFANVAVILMMTGRNHSKQASIVNSIAAQAMNRQYEAFEKMAKMERDYDEKLHGVETRFNELRIQDAETIGRLREQIEQFKRQSQADSMTIRQQNQRIEAMTQQLNSAQAKLGDYDALQSEVDALREELAELRRQVEKMNKELEEMKQQRDAAQRALEQARLENAALQQVKQALEDRIEELQTRLKRED